MESVDVIIIGAGAAGLMCAIESAKRGRRVTILDHANRAGKKILMSGGGRCNFTNYHIDPNCFISHNKHFCKSALSRYTQWDFIALVQRYGIAFHEKALGQLFCTDKAAEIVTMLLSECAHYNVTIRLNTVVTLIDKKAPTDFRISTSSGLYQSQSLVVACGGLSIPTMGASPFGYKIAEQFGLKIWPTRAGLVPLTLQPEDKERLSVLSGISIDSAVSSEQTCFRDYSLFTHRGLSGPAILQISSYWSAGAALNINCLPTVDLLEHFKGLQKTQPLKQLQSILLELLPKRLVELFLPAVLASKRLADMRYREFEQVALLFNAWRIKPNGTEGYRTAEVTLGGIDCDTLSSKTMEVHTVPGLYFIGEVVDVAGWLGGYNFQWAWSSGWAAGQVA